MELHGGSTLIKIDRLPVGEKNYRARPLLRRKAYANRGHHRRRTLLLQVLMPFPLTRISPPLDHRDPA